MPNRTVSLGGQSFEFAEITMGDLRRIPDLAPAITTMMSFRPQGDAPVFPSAAQIDALATIYFASAQRARPDVTREQFDAAFNAAGSGVMFKLFSQASSLVMGTSESDVKDAESAAGEAASPSS